MLVTGGAGFIGSHIVDEALHEGYEVTVLDNLTSGSRDNLPTDVKFVQVDIRDREAVIRQIIDAKPDIISHHAAQVSVSVSVTDPLLDAQTNIIGLLNVLDGARNAGAKRFIFASSGGAIHGEVPVGQKANQDWPAAPISPYAASKLSGEAYLKAYSAQFGIETIALRYANVYGPRQNPHGEAGVVAVFASRMIAGNPVQINAKERVGDDGCERDYVYVRDVARANMLAARGDLITLLNVGTGVATSTRTLATLMAEIGNFTPTIKGALPKAGDIQRSVLDERPAYAQLGNLVSLHEGLTETLAWFRTRQKQQVAD
jgi:UDP-glucose 4-epimerase